MKEFSLTTPQSSDKRKKPERFLFLTTESAEGAPWGEFEPLRDTSWATGIGVVSGETMAHALHGFTAPLLEELGRPPHASGRRIPEEEAECRAKDACPSWDKSLCRPGGRGPKALLGPPECYEAPLSMRTPDALMALFTRVALAWRENRYTLVIDGPGFNLR